MKGPILIVDDEADTAALLDHAFQEAGFTDTRVVTDPTQAMGACRDTKPNLILLDLRMAVMDGFEILDLLAGTPDPPPVLVLTADCSRAARNRALAMGAKDFLSKPYDETELLLRAKNLLETRRLQEELRRINQDLERTVSERTRALWLAVQQVEKRGGELRESQEQTAIRLALAAELKDDETTKHVTRFSHYCRILAEGRGYDRESAELLRLASVMHDVGKIGIPDRILLATGTLNDEDRALMQRHTEMGFAILDGSHTALLDLAASIALTHHERYDGSGYPNGLAGGSIPLEGRIAAIADVFDALTTDRVYRRRFDLGTALRMMTDGRGREFDPELLDLFMESLDQVLKVKEENEDVV